MTDINPLPALPDELPPRAIDLPFEIEPEHVELFRATLDACSAEPNAPDPDWSTATALAEVLKLVWIEHVLPIEQALAESEGQVAELGRRMYAALHDKPQAPAPAGRTYDADHADRLVNGAYDR
jgi:hypothetical protein